MKLFSTLQLFRAATAASCFGTMFPAYIREACKNSGDAEWLSITTNKDETNSYLGGYFGQYPFAANYELSTGQYLWSKIYHDITGNVQFNAVNLKSDESVLALAGSTADKMALFVFLVDPNTGSQLYAQFRVDLDYPASLLNDQSMLFTAGSRLYLTPEFDRGQSFPDGNSSIDGIQIIVVEYKTNGVTKLWHKFSIRGQDGGSSANLINLLPTAADGSEKVLMGGGYSHGGNNAFVIALYLISPIDGQISQINLQYGAGGTLFTDQTVYHYFARTRIFGNYLYAVTRSAKQDARGIATNYCMFKFTDSTFSQLDTSVRSNQKCLSQNGGHGYSSTQVILDFIPLDNSNGKVHAIAYDSENQRLLYVRIHIQDNPVTRSQEFVTIQLNTGLSYKAAIMAKNVPVYQFDVLQGNYVHTRQAYGVGGTYSFTSYTSPITNTAKMPYINAIQIASSCSTQNTYTELYVASGSYQVLFTEIFVVAQSTTFQTVQSFSSNSNPVTTSNAKTSNLNFNCLTTCNLCRSYSTVNTAAGSFPSQILYQSNINAALQCSFTPNTATSSTCSAPDAWVYTIDESSLGLSYDIFAINPVTNQVQMLLRDTQLAVGVYQMTIVGTLPNLQTQSFQFSLTIAPGSLSSTCSMTPTCVTSFETTLAVIPVALADKAYTIADSQLLYVTPAFSLTSAYCTADDIVYSMTVTPVTNGQSTSFITFETASRTVTVESASNLDAGTFNVLITGSVTNLLQTITSSQSFTLTVTPLACSLSSESITIVPDPSFIQRQTEQYTITSPTAILQQTSFLVIANYCAQQDVVYTMIVTPMTQGQSITFITFDSTSRIVYVTSQSNSDAGTYTVEIQGTVTNLLGPMQASQSFTLTVTPLACSLSSDSMTITADPSFIQEQTLDYIITSAPDSLQIPAFLLTASYCAQSDIVYYQTITSTPRGLPTLQFTFNQETLTTSWHTENNKLAGNYTVKIEASVTNSLGTQTASVMFKLTFILPANQPPTLLGYTQPNFDISEVRSIQLGPIYDPDEDQTVTVVYIVIPRSTKIKFKDGVLTIDPEVKVGDYIVIITLTDSFTINPGVTQYTLQLNKQEVVQPQTVNISTVTNHTVSTAIKTGQHNFSKMTINQLGLCTVHFSELLAVPVNYTEFNQTQLNIYFVPPFSVEPNKMKFNWNLTEFNPSFMQIQINFENPLYISSRTKLEYDTLQMILMDPDKFISLSTHTAMTNQTNISQSVPAQFASQYDFIVVSSMVKNVTLVVTTVVAATFVLSLVLQALLQQLWSMVNCLQIIAYLTFFNVFLPANASTFFECILNAANFNLIPVQKIYTTLFPFLQAAQTDAEKEIFEQIQVLLLSAILMILFIPVLIGLYYLKRHYKSLERVYQFINHFIFWNAPIRYVMESYSSITYFAIAFAAVNLSFKTTLTGAWSTCVIIALSVYVIIPAAVTLYFRRRFKLFTEKKFLQKFKDVMSKLNWRNKNNI